MKVRIAGRERRLTAVKRAAWSSFVERGFAATTIRQIAAEAGVSTGTVMSFGNKSTLLLELFDDAIAERIGATPVPSDDPAEAVWACYRPYFEFFRDQQTLARSYASVLFSGGQREPAALGTKAEQFNGYVAQVVSARCPGVTAGDASRAAEAIFAVYLHTLMRWATGFGDADDAEATFTRQLSWQLSRFKQK